MNRLRQLLLPQPHRKLPYARAWNIAARTAHIAVTGVLLGGHVFNHSPEQLITWFYLTLLTGALLLAIEVYPSCRWCYQGRGVMVFAKLVLMLCIPWCWDQRVALLVAILVIASVGSHMPGRFRYYSFVHRRVLD